MNFRLVNKTMYIYVYLFLVILATRLFQHHFTNRYRLDDVD